MQMSLSRFMAIVSLSKTASTDATRYNLNGVNFSLKTGEGSATDGHMLSSTSIPLNGEDVIRDESDPETIIVSLEALAAMGKIKKRDVFAYTVKLTKDKACLSGLGTESCWPNIDGTFPDVAQIWPRAESEGIEIGLNAELLLALAKAIQGDKKSPTIKIKVIKPEQGKSGLSYSPIVVTTDTGRGLLMPVRM